MSDSNPVLQVISLKVKEGVSVEDFAEVNRKFQSDVAPHLPGLERREYSISPDGDVKLFLKYKDMESAKAGPRGDSGNEIAGKFMTMIDMSSMTAAFYPLG